MNTLLENIKGSTYTLIQLGLPKIELNTGTIRIITSDDKSEVSGIMIVQNDGNTFELLFSSPEPNKSYVIKLVSVGEKFGTHFRNGLWAVEDLRHFMIHNGFYDETITDHFIQLMVEYVTKLNSLKEEATEARKLKEREERNKRCLNFPKYIVKYDYDVKKWIVVPTIYQWPSYVSENEWHDASVYSKIESKNTVAIRNNKYNGGMTKLCRDCGTAFYLEPEHIQWFHDRDLIPFSRCDNCRNKVNK